MSEETLSSEQAAIVYGDNSGDKWEPIDENKWREWEQPLPHSIIKDAHIDWMEGYGNPPRCSLLLQTSPLEGLEKQPVWDEIKPGCYLGMTPQGFAQAHYHKGGLQVRQKVDGTTFIGTPQSDGYGGRHFPIHLSPKHPKYPNQEVVLCGPWHGCPPEGYQEVNHVLASEPQYFKDRPWSASGGYFGLLVPDLLFLAIMAEFLPHMRWAYIYRSYGTFITPLRPETGYPKGFLCLPDMCSEHIIRTQGSRVPKKFYDRCIKCGTMRKDIEEAGGSYHE